MNETVAPSSRQRWAMIAAAFLLAANIVVPVVWGDVYPFTSAPMFRAAPAQCCNYRVFVDGKEEPAANWLLHRIYDGNPVGYGVGVCPPPILEQEYGVIHTEDAIRHHILKQLNSPAHQNDKTVEVVQDTLGPTGQSVGIIKTTRYTIQQNNKLHH